MVLNEFKDEIGRLCEVNGINKARLAANMGMTRQALNKYLDDAGVTKGLVKITEALGYDIEVQYVKRRPTKK